MAALNDAYVKLASLSEDQAELVVALIHDLVELEAIENAQDLADAREVLGEIKAELDALHD